MTGELEQQKTGYEVNFKQKPGVGLSGLVDRFLQKQTILFGEILLADIAAIDRKESENLDERTLEAVEGDVGAMAVATRDALEQMGEAFDIAGHVLADDQPFLLTRDLRTRLVDAAELSIGLGKFVLVFALAENAIDVIQKIVPGRSL